MDRDSSRNDGATEQLATHWSQLTVDEPAILVAVDVQKGFVGPSTQHVPGLVLDLVRAKKDQFKSVVATRFFNEPDSNFQKLIDWHRLTDSPDTDLVEGLEPLVDDIIDKETYGAVRQIAAVADKNNARVIYICGIDTDVCVLQNAAGLFDLGYEPRVIVEASGTNGGPDAQKAAIALLNRTIGGRQVIHSDD